MLEIVPANFKFDFLGKRAIAFFLSACLIALSAYTWFNLGEKKFGIDYLGGHELVVKIDGDITDVSLRALLADGGFDAVVQAFESEDGEYSLRLADERSSSELKKAVSETLEAKHPGAVTIIKADFVGPTIGAELKRNALIAILVSLAGMLLYISVRFELAFAIGAVAALFHDVIITMGIYLLSGMTISVATLAAALTIVGYSVNDTIIVFDRIREEIFKRSSYNLEDLINESISSTLSRTVITSLLTLFSALALLLFGGGAIRELALFLCVGVVLGTYSTIFIASPVALLWEQFQARGDKKGDLKSASNSGSSVKAA